MTKTDKNEKKIDYNQLSTDIFNEINKVRRNPQYIIPHLIKMKQFYKHKEYRNPILNYYILTEEGVEAVKEAIKFVKIQKSLKPLIRFNELDNSANELVEFLLKTGKMEVDEKRDKEERMEIRIRKHFKKQGGLAENISFGWSNAIDIVLQMIIDDGVKSRGHCKNLFAEHFNFIGVFSGDHKVLEHCSVIEFFGEPVNNEYYFDKYYIDKDNWPQNAVSLQKHIEIKTEEDIKIITLTYIFKLDNNKEIKKIKEFIEKFSFKH